MMANRNCRFCIPVFNWNFPVLIMIAAQLLAGFRLFNLNNSDSSDLDNYNFNNKIILYTLYFILFYKNH